MTQIYEAAMWWLALWMPEDSRFFWLLDDATIDEVTDEFWTTIAPRNTHYSPWYMRSEALTYMLFVDYRKKDLLNTTRYFYENRHKFF